MVVQPPARGDARAAYLPELAATVWPAPADASLRRGGRAGYAVLPSAARPRLLVPAGARRAAASAIRHSTEAVGLKARLRRRLLATAFRSGLGPLAFRDRLLVEAAGGEAAGAAAGGEAVGAAAGLEAHLGAVLRQQVLLSLHIGPARANRKPVVQLLDGDGSPLGFAKLGVDPLTRALVGAEVEALRRLGALDLGAVTVAEVLHHGDWGGHVLLLQSALPVHLRRAAGSAATAAEHAAMVTVAGCLGLHQESYAGSGYAKRLTAAVDALGEHPDAARLRAMLDRVADADPALRFGCWHGDWNGGNSAVLADGRVLVWDWERFDVDVPAGYDALHRRLQTAVTRQGIPPPDAARRLLADAPATLAGFGQPDTSADLVAVLYLAELATRYLRDRQAEAGARLGHIDAWLLPAVEQHLAGRDRQVAKGDGMSRGAGK
jgi:hypothetical protein